MERSKLYNKQNLSKTQQTKRKRRKFPNVFFKKELVKVFDNIEEPKIMMGSFLTFFCALRISEVCNLRWQDIDLENRRLKIVDGKCHKDGFVPISSICISILRIWREMNKDEEYFLPSDNVNERKLSRSGLLKGFKRALRKADLEIPTKKNARGRQQHQYKFHTLRHSRCTHLLNNGIPIQKDIL